MKADSIVRGVGVLVGLGLIAYGVLHRERPPSVATDATQTTSPAPAATAGDVTRSEVVRPLGLSDPAHVDVLEAYAVAKAAVLEGQPGAELFGISASGFVRGTLDLTRAAAPDAGAAMPLVFQFEIPGGDGGHGAVKRHVDVRVERTGLRIASVDGAVLARAPGGRSAPALDEPTCSSKKAWATAVETGVPEDVAATFLLSTDQGRLVWSLWVPGQPLHHRLIDAKTCALVARPTVGG